MADSLSLVTAQIAFQHTELAIVHIPIAYYSLFLHPILRLLFGDDHDDHAHNVAWTNRHDFLNISITPTEISIIGPQELIQRFVLPVARVFESCLPQDASAQPCEIGAESYTVVQVDGQGLDAGQRVLELTGPLAMAGIPVFFITTYFSDYILVPSRSRRTVTLALEQRGFVFSEEVDAFVSQLSPTLHHGHGQHDFFTNNNPPWSSAPSHSVVNSIPTTPPAQDIDELQGRTFRKLHELRIQPQADASLRLVSCAGGREPDADMEARLKEDLLQVLLSTSPEAQIPCPNEQDPRSETDPSDLSATFLSITITHTEPVAILFEEKLLPRLGSSLFGAKEAADVLVPIMFDLRQLGFETTGIVGGVAARLATGSKQSKQRGRSADDVSPTSDMALPIIEINFLSMAKSGAVIVRASQFEKAVKELELGYAEHECAV